MKAWLDRFYQQESRRVLATLIRLLGDFDLAEEALHEAFAAAMKQWPEEGIPTNPRAWLVSAGRFRAIDQIRRRARHDAVLAQLAEQLAVTASDEPPEPIEDDRLRLIFTCCHPALSTDAQLALTLREVCGLTTEEVARAFLTKPATLAQRIVRAKAKIRDAGIPYEVPETSALAPRLQAVLHTIYLMFNEGYSALSGDQLLRRALADEAIRLARLLCELLPEPEAFGLLALMLLHDARREARIDSAGDLVPLEEQNRSRWHQDQIAEGRRIVLRLMYRRGYGAYTLQAAIAAVHAEAMRADDTDWKQIVGLYTVLQGIAPSPVVALNRAVAVAMAHGPAQGLALMEAIETSGELATYHLLYAAKADLLRRLERIEQARAAYERALALCEQEPERRFLRRRLATLPLSPT
ncbi:RNA polymerase sigma factor [Marinobacter sp. SS21]|uniref:RNA polymerase sigma factor n=1 Tax=Marinobacter sp. SS21 TaxID=2979460 RepID=UPI00232E8951|nr:RNA polymerase sigma factor [Marinobacter sp. SS21]MDC0662378.1 RNA polymerase sigma factor [Marinobacter sp. SS21]